MASSLFTGLELFIIFFSISSCTHSSQPQSSEPSFSVSIIHRDSPLSPFYNPNATEFDRVRDAYRRTVSRAQYLKQMADDVSPETITAYVFTDVHEYVMSYYIGTPQKQVYAIVDTASSLIWIQCLPCERCFNQTPPIHDPSQSDSYRKMRCNDPRCPHVSDCSTDGFCTYYRRYADGSYSNGVIGTETFVFIDDSAHYYQARFENIIFGCGHENEDIFGSIRMGIVGFSRQPLSLLSQLKVTKFSHCFFSYKSEFSSSRIHFGDEAILTGPKTPILFVPKLPFVYFLILDGITVGDERLKFPPGTFKVSKSGDNGFFIDTGTAYTLLMEAPHSRLVYAIYDKSSLKQTMDPDGLFDMCFDVEDDSDIIEYTPDITLHFSGGLDMKWKKSGTYIKINDGTWCLAVARGADNSILGNYQLQDFNIGYNIAQNFLYIDERDTCVGS